MKKYSLALLAGLVFVLLSKAAQAQTGCTDSPENPTAVLAVVGLAGGIVSSALPRWRARRKSKTE